MGVLGRYIDSLPDEARDRIVEAGNWGPMHLCRADGTRCLIGHAENVQYATIYVLPYMPIIDGRQRFQWTYSIEPAIHFDALCYRFGLPRIVRACKLRAARNNSLPAQQLHYKLQASHNTPAEV